MALNLNHLSGGDEAAGETTAPRSGPPIAPRLGRTRAVDEHAWDPQVKGALDESFPEVAETAAQVEIIEEQAEILAEEAQILDAAPPTDLEVAIPEILLVPNSFLCGPAGTGKTYLARSWMRQSKGTILAATTGIASVNLGEGTTINSLLGYFDTDSLRESYTSGYLGMRLGKLWRAGIRRILTDEVSMMDAEQLTMITRALDELAGRGFGVMDVDLQDEIEQREDDTEDPIALTLIGDFAQLPPVKAAFAFESPEWPRYAKSTHQLTQIHRQADRPFIDALQAARRGDSQAVIDFFGPSLQRISDANFDGTTIFGTNDAVSRYNQLRMDKLKTPQKLYAAERWGEQRTDWKHIPDQLAMKEGALVMVLANERRLGVNGMPGPLIYANGDLGTLVECDPARKVAKVRLHRNDRIEEIAWVTRQNTIPLAVGRRKELRAAGLDHLIEGRFEIVGTVTYMPLRLAWGTTVHKSQGLSLDSVQVNTNEGMFKQPGLLYVALSRARTAAGLRIIGSVEGLRTRCTVHAKVREWL